MRYIAEYDGDFVDEDRKPLSAGEVLRRATRGEPVYELGEPLSYPLGELADVSDAAPPTVARTIYEQDVVGGEIMAPEIDTEGDTSIASMAVQAALDRAREDWARQKRIEAQLGADAPELVGEEQAELQRRILAQSQADSFMAADEEGERVLRDRRDSADVFLAEQQAGEDAVSYQDYLDNLTADEAKDIIARTSAHAVIANPAAAQLVNYLKFQLPKKELQDQADSLAERFGLSQDEVQSVIDGELSAELSPTENFGLMYGFANNPNYQGSLELQKKRNLLRLERYIANHIFENYGEERLTSRQRSMTRLGAEDALITWTPPVAGTVLGIVGGGPAGVAVGAIGADAALRELFDRDPASLSTLLSYAAVPYAPALAGQGIRQIPNIGRAASKANPFGVNRDVRFADFGPFLPRGLTPPRLTTITAPRTTPRGIEIVQSAPMSGNLALSRAPAFSPGGIQLLDDWIPPGASIRMTPRGITIVEAPPLITTRPTIPIIRPTTPRPALPPTPPEQEPQPLPPDSPFYDPGKDPSDPDIYIEPDVLPDTRPKTPYVAPDKPPYIDPGHLPGPEPGDDPYTEPDPDPDEPNTPNLSLIHI